MMILNEFIKETDKNQMIKELLKHYKVESVKWKYKSMKDYAHFDVDRGVLQLSSRYLHYLLKMQKKLYNKKTNLSIQSTSKDSLLV